MPHAMGLVMATNLHVICWVVLETNQAPLPKAPRGAVRKTLYLTNQAESPGTEHMGG
jgi:hypothetical protein